MQYSMIKDATMKRSTVKEWIKQSTVATAAVKQCLTFLFALSVLSLGWVSASQAAQQVTYYHNNLQGSAIAATNEQGEVVWRESYQPFGKKTKNEAAAADNSPAFTGHVQDKETGLLYMQARYYDPRIGRFMSQDPVGFVASNPMSFNRYLYVNNNPYKYVDPDGRFLNFIAGAIAGAVIDAAVQYATTGEVNLQDVAMAAISGSVGPVGIAQKAAKFGKAVLKAAKKIKKSKGDTPRCFVEGTLVHTPNGLIPIEEIQVGDLVASRDVLTGDTTWKPVARLYRHSDKSIFNLTLVNAAGEKERLGVTPEHPFWVEGQGWIDAGQLQEGQIISSVDGKVLTVNSIVLDNKLHDTYNFEVTDYNTYFVGEQGAWVHNQCGEEDTKNADNLVHRGGSGTPTNLTPRPKDTGGLSGNVNPLPGKNQVIDTSKLDKLCAVCDNAKTGHVSIKPKDMSQMQDWIDSRGSGTTHPLTQELMDAVVDQVKK